MSTLARIQEHQELRMSNVLSFRKKLTQAELQAEAARVNAFIEGGGFAKTAPTVTATFAVEGTGASQTMDIELLIALDKEFTPPEGCTRKPEFVLTNAVPIRHEGSPAGLQQAGAALTAYLQEHALTPITTGYNVTVRDAKTPAEMDNMIVDIYIGVSPNIL
ncbi:hypothetical protein FACS1894208_06650 [Clostridia bacterium]|nr:hypothetical protein FACS1894208_06650 [Clostridia bacterium]